MKYSGWGDYKGDLTRLTKRFFDTFGPERIIWGTLGNTLADSPRGIDADAQEGLPAPTQWPLELELAAGITK